MTRDEIFSSVTERILSSLRKGTLPWRQRWDETTESIPLSLPMNAKTSKPYNGVNIPLLWMTGFTSPYWATEKAWGDIGAVVIEGESPVEIYFSSFVGPKRIPLLKDYKVYNLEQVLGCDHLRLNLRVEPDFQPAIDLVIATRAVVRESESAFYDVGNDIIYRPARHRFASDIGYHTTELHELVHWTGKRLKRAVGCHKDSPEYAEEELVAELGTCFLTAALDIPERLSEMPNHANYIGAWWQQLNNDRQAFFRASGAAQKAAKFLLEHVREKHHAKT